MPEAVDGTPGPRRYDSSRFELWDISARTRVSASGERDEQGLLTVHEVGEELGLNVREVHDLIDAGALPTVRTGRTVLVRRADLTDARDVSDGG
jgi:excisionase family DNA binding protein